MITASPGFSALDYQSFAFSRVFKGKFRTIGGHLLYHTPSPLGPGDYLETQNNFTPQDIVVNDGEFIPPPIYRRPISAADREGGRICTVSGFWAPARFIVYVDGQPQIKEFARIPESARYNRSYIPHTFGG